jgi:ubiquinone/menaquinone biosynthesis C-methylase UbiE
MSIGVLRCGRAGLGYDGKMKSTRALGWLCLFCLFVRPGLRTVLAQKPDGPGARYEFRSPHDPDGTGKFYLGREIACVMGHQGADWLERAERQEEERPDLLLPALNLKPGDAVADIGAGTGYYTRRLARLVGRDGTVYAVDIQPEMLELLTNKMAELQLKNVKPCLGTVTDPKLPVGAVDLVLMVDVYHEFDHPYEMLQSICRALKPGGRVVFVEFRAEDPAVPIKPLHKMTEAQVRKEMTGQPLEWVETKEILPRQHIIFFRKRH